MTLETLLERLQEHLPDFSFEEKPTDDGTKVFVLQAKLPEIPFGQRKHAWYYLVLDEGQTEIPQREIDTIMRHFWHAQDDLSDAPGTD